LDDCVRNDFKGGTIESNLAKILSEFSAFEGLPLDIVEQLRDNYSIEHFYNWLFDPTHFEIVSSLKFDGSDLYLLSPGKKA